MDYIKNLTDEEKNIICEIITGKSFKNLFQQNEQEFSRIQKGFRAKSLTDEKALSIAKSKIKQPLISGFINSKLERWLKDIQQNTIRRNKFCSFDDAEAISIYNSVFKEDFDLYFKLKGTPLDSESHTNFDLKLKSIESKRKADSEFETQIQNLMEQKQRLSNEIKEFRDKNEIQKCEYEQSIQEYKLENEKLKIDLAKKEAKIIELETPPKILSSIKGEILNQFNDIDTSLLPLADSDETVSLCKVIYNAKGERRLKRYADLNENGSFELFFRNKDKEPYFENRAILFYKDGPSEEGFYGIWRWHAESKNYGSSKDRIYSFYISELDPIEIVEIKNIESIADLIAALKSGVEIIPHSRRILFSFKASNQKYWGILFNSRELRSRKQKFTLPRESTSTLIYEFSSNETLLLDNNHTFYTKVFIGVPKQLYFLKTPLEIVKDIVLSSISWSTYQEAEITRTKRQEFRSFLEAIPTNEVVSKIGAACYCSKPAAQKILDEFMANAWQYLDGNSLEDEVLRHLITVDTELQDRTKELIRKEWENENEILLTRAKEKQEALQFEFKEASDKLKEKQEALKQIESEENHLRATISEKEKLALEVEEAVEHRIQNACNNVADFIANMAFVGGSQKTHTSNLNEETSQTDQNLYTVTSESKNLEDLEIHHSWEEVINTAIDELQEAGVSTSYSRGLATFLCAAYIEKQPILLIGPNAIDIAQAFSAAVTAKKYGILRCEGDYSQQNVEKIGRDEESIVLINNFIANNWINRLPEVLSNKDVFYIATYPYEEDIQVEPRSLYDFMLPVFTESFVDEMASGFYDGGYFSDDFIPFENSENGKKKELKLPKIGVSPIIKNSLQNLISTMYRINASTSNDDLFLFCIFPIVYATTPFHELAEKVNSLYQNLGISTNLKRDLQYILEKSNG